MRLLSLSSLATSQLVLYNNPDGLEENWFSFKWGLEVNGTVLIDADFQQNKHLAPAPLSWDIKKKVVIQACSLLLAVAAVVESAAYLIILPCTLLIAPVKGLDLTYRYAALLSSSSFTVIWNLAGHLFCRNAPVEEPFARLNFKKSLPFFFFSFALFLSFMHSLVGRLVLNNPRLKPLYMTIGKIVYFCFETRIFLNFQQFPDLSNEDIEYIEDWLEENRDNLIVLKAIFHRKRGWNEVERGSALLEEVLFKPDSVDKTTLEQIEESSEGCFHLCGTRAVYPYLFGDKKRDPIPTFFNPETRIEIRKFRKETLGTSGTDFSTQLHSLSSFEKTVFESEDKQKRWIHLKSLGFRAVQGGTLFTQSFPMALDRHRGEKSSMLLRITRLFNQFVESHL